MCGTSGQRRVGPVEDRARRHRRLTPAPRAHPHPPPGRTPRLVPTTGRAHESARPARPRQVLQAVLLGAEPRHQLLMRARVVHPHHRNPLVHTPNLLDSSRYPIHQFEAVRVNSHAAPDAEGPVPLALRVRAAADALGAAGRGAQQWPATVRAAVIADVDRAIAALTTVRADLLVAQRDSGAWKGRGDPTFEAWRARTSRSGMRATMAEVRRAETLATMPAVREAAVTGRVTVEHVDVVARIAAGASVPVREALGSDQGQATLVELARRIDARQFARSVALWAAGLDAGAHERDHQAQRAARFLHLADTDGGTRISGQLDRMAGHRLRLALEAASGRPGVDDERTSEQRRADALGAIAEKVLSLPD